MRNFELIAHESINWIVFRPLSIFEDGGIFADWYVKDTIENDLKLVLHRLEEDFYDDYEKSTWRLHLNKPKDYSFFNQYYVYSNHKLRAEYRNYHDEICSHLWDFSGDGKKRTKRKLEDNSSLVPVLHT